jgi:hypothetical protein
MSVSSYKANFEPQVGGLGLGPSNHGQLTLQLWKIRGNFIFLVVYGLPFILEKTPVVYSPTSAIEHKFVMIITVGQKDGDLS